MTHVGAAHTTHSGLWHVRTHRKLAVGVDDLRLDGNGRRGLALVKKGLLDGLHAHRRVSMSLIYDRTLQ